MAPVARRMSKCNSPRSTGASCLKPAFRSLRCRGCRPPVMAGGSSGGNEATILRLQARGELLLDTGEVEAARTLLRTAAEAGSVAAALRLAETYDPAEIQRLGMAERSADLGLAVRWYEHAQTLGSPVAAARLVALGRR